jgi:molybdopterin molybdotransferase
MKDATARVIEARGKLLFHGIAMKPGKPTILGIIDEKPVFGLPGHPVAADFISQLFVREALRRLGGSLRKPYPVSARLTEAVSSNHGRAEYLGVRLEEGGAGPAAVPIRGKSGLITSLAGSDGYISIPRDCEGFPRGAAVPVYLWGC